MQSLDGKVAWVTGAGTGIGQGGAFALARSGVKMVLSGRRREPLEETAAAIREQGGEVVVEPLDIADPAAVEAVAARIADRYGRLDILLNSAGINIPERHWDSMTVEGWKQVIDIDLNGAFYCVKAVLPAMRKQQDGLIINVSSMAGKRVGYISGVPYSAAKHAMNSMTEAINLEECHRGIRACALCPGEVATPILDKRPVPVSAEARARMVQPEDMGETILFLARLPRHVCVNELLITPTWNRGYIGLGKEFGPSRD